MPAMRPTVRSIFAFALPVALILAPACRSDESSAPKRASPDEAAEPAEAAPPPTQVVEPDGASSSREILTAVRTCLGWSLEDPLCKSGSDIVTFGLSEAIENPSLGRAAAASRARAELAERLGRRTPTVRLRGSRVPRVIPCGDRYLALAVLRADLEAEACPSGFATLAPPSADAATEGDAATCASWVHGFGESTERGYLGVGAATGLSSEQLEEQTARHRAVNNALSVHETELRGGRAMQLGSKTPAKVVSLRTTQCRGVTFAEVEVELTGEAAPPSAASP
jgi:hypothetical protein